jgi:hypothetical protein
VDSKRLARRNFFFALPLSGSSCNALRLALFSPKSPRSCLLKARSLSLNSSSLASSSNLRLWGFGSFCFEFKSLPFRPSSLRRRSRVVLLRLGSMTSSFRVNTEARPTKMVQYRLGSSLNASGNCHSFNFYCPSPRVSLIPLPPMYIGRETVQMKDDVHARMIAERKGNVRTQKIIRSFAPA